MVDTPMIARPFCGRTDELAGLQAAFDRLRGPEPKPELVVILGESGLGKTRLVQQFYGWLSTERDGVGAAGYWPDRLSPGDIIAEVNPTEPCNGAAPLPYLWLGIRCRDKLTDLETHVSALKPHLLPLAEAKERQKLAAEWVEKLASSAVKLIPIVGPLLVEAWSWFKDGRKVFKVLPKGSRAAQLQEAETNRRLGSAKALVELLAELLDAPAALTNLKGQQRRLRRLAARVTRTPAVIVIDDAQWAERSAALIAFIRQLLDAAAAGGWPLMVVATHWEREWNEALDLPDADSFARVATDWAAKHAPGWAPLRLRPQTGETYGRIVALALPGLTAAQREVLLERAGGNALLLEKIVDHARRNPALFEGRDPAGPLTAAGLAALAARDFQIHELVAERLQMSPPAVRLAAALSALQGMEFTRRLTLEIAERLGKPGVADGLAQIENPQALVLPVEPGVYSFAQRAFHDVARQDLANVADEGQAQAAVMDSVRAVLADAGALAELSPGERNELRQLAAPLLEATGEALDKGQAAALWLELAAEAAKAWDSLTTAAYAERALAADPQLAHLPAGDFDPFDLFWRLIELDRKTLALDLARLGGPRWIQGRDLFGRLALCVSLRQPFEHFGEPLPGWLSDIQQSSGAELVQMADRDKLAEYAQDSGARTQAAAAARAAQRLGEALDIELEALETFLSQTRGMGAPGEVIAEPRILEMMRLINEADDAPLTADLGRWTPPFRAEVLRTLATRLFALLEPRISDQIAPDAAYALIDRLGEAAFLLLRKGDGAVVEMLLRRVRPLALKTAAAARSAKMSAAAARVMLCLTLLDGQANRFADAHGSALEMLRLRREALSIAPSPAAWSEIAESLILVDAIARQLNDTPRPPAAEIIEAYLGSEEIGPVGMAGLMPNFLTWRLTLPPEEAETAKQAVLPMLARLQQAGPPQQTSWIPSVLAALA